MAASAMLVAVAGLLLFWVVRKVRQYYALRAFGGHWAAGWTRMWHLQTSKSGRMNKIFTDINDQYGRTRSLAHSTW